MSKPRVGSEMDRFEKFIETKGQTVIQAIGTHAEIPEEVRGLNWGAFGLGPIWGTAMRVHISWLCMLPMIGMIMPFILLFKGNQWAWEKGRWHSIEHFKRVQIKWAWATAIVYFVMAIFYYQATSYISRTILSY